MPSPSSVVLNRRNRRLDQKHARASNVRRAGVGLGIILSLILALLILLAALAYADLTRDLPSVAVLPTLLNPPDGLLLQPTRLYDRTAQHLLFTFSPPHLAQPDGEGPGGRAAPRRYLPLSTASPQHLPSFLPKATVVLLDPGFWTHGGYQLSGLSDPSSHPTIAQKLVSDLLLYDEPPSLRRALRERLLAAQVTAEYGRSQVLEWYLNSADFGNYAYGIDSAAQLYFGKSATDLTPAECAVLAATSQSPSLNPLDAPDLALQRGRTAIELMQKFGLISADEGAKALSEQPSPIRGSSISNPAGAGALPAQSKISNALFTELVLHQLDPRFTRDRITRGGLIVLTTLDYDLQKAVSPQLSTANSQPPTSVIILNPQSGQILAADATTSGGSALLTPHDPGTLMTPFIYLTAFTRGLSPGSMVWDIGKANPEGASPTSVPGGADVPALPTTPASQYHGPVRMRIALANDYLAPADTIAAQMGADAIHRTEASFGLIHSASRSPNSPSEFGDRGAGPQGRVGPSDSETTLLDMATAYGIFAAGGVRYGQPDTAGDTPAASAVLRVEGLDHSIWLDLTNPQAQPIVSPALAYLMNNVLSDEAARWPSLGHPNELEIGRPLGVKLGQSASGADTWAIGYTPTRLAAVWQGMGDPAAAPAANNQSAFGEGKVGSVLSALIGLATQNLPPDGWVAPPDVTTLEVCDPSGLLPTKDCPSLVNEVFLSGNEPVQADTLFRSFTVNRETGYLATVFTPPELVEDKVFMVLPPEAQDWAKTANVQVAPTSFDAIQAPPVNPDVHISTPAIFADVSGQVQFRGTASGADFDHYRLLVGKGLNPQSWIVVGDDSTTRIEDGLLGTWDTTGLSGLYAVELQVIRTDQRIDTAIMQVTVK